MTSSNDQFTENPKISVIIPVYNTETYLEECLQSCSVQTLRDVEFLLINDGSTDHSQQIIDRYAKEDPRFISITLDHRGVSHSRNIALEKVKGEVVMFLDSDDFYAPNACETVWDEYLKNDPDIIIFKTNIYTNDPEVINPWLSRTLTHISRKFYETFTPDTIFNEPASKPFMWRDAFRRKFIEAHHSRFSEDLVLAEDLVFQMNTFPHAGRVSFIPDELYYYRRGNSGAATTRITDLKDKIPQHLTAFEQITAYWQEQGWLSLYWEQYVPWAYNFVMQDILKEEPADALDHLRAIFGLTHHYQLGKYIENLSPEIYESFSSLEAAIENPSLSEEDRLGTLEVQMRILLLLMKNHLLRTRNEQSRARNEVLAVELKQNKMQVKELSGTNTKLRSKLDHVTEELRNEKELRQKFQEELKNLYGSLSWRLGHKLVQPLHAIRKLFGR